MAKLSKKSMTAREIIYYAYKMEDLVNAGHSRERAEEIIKEAENSSNPEYVYNYYGIK